MKICFAICEYNPFHNGHAEHLNYIRKNIAPDCLAIIMSGNFTQRGETAIMDKYTRAAHAIKAGADIVFELPTAFSVAPAEIFAKGGVKLASAFKCKKTLCFGTESAEKQKLISTAKALLDESKEFKKLYKAELKTGITPIRAKIAALGKMNIENLDFELLKTPNNILGVEYAKAVIGSESDIELCPIIRHGTGYNEVTLTDESPSALAIRTAIADGKLKKIKPYVPSFVYPDLPEKLPSADDLLFYSVIKTPKNELAKILDCGEGLENRIKALAKNCLSANELKEKLKTKRYTYARLTRILTSCMLGITEKSVRKSLSQDLYLKVLAVNKDKTDLLSSLSSVSSYPLITRKSDVIKLDGAAEECFRQDVFANDLYNFICSKHTNEFEMKLV